jgi:putative DNA primase/helicase
VERADRKRRPQIIVRPMLSVLVDEAEAALAKDPQCAIYTRAGFLVHVVRDGSRHVPGLDRPIGTPVIVPVPVHHLRECLDRTARWVKYDNGGQKMVPTLPPMFVANALAARGEWILSPLEAIIETPTMRPDGSILDSPGYDQETAVLFEPGTTQFPSMPPSASFDDAVQALAEIRDPFGDFPFVAESDLSALLAYLLTVLARPAITGPCPLFALRAPTPGSGKGLLANVVSVIATGRNATIMTPIKDDDEARKRLLAIGLGGARTVVIDNVTGSFGSASMAAALTTGSLSDRVLGLSQLATVPIRAVFALTGNNVVFRGDLARRVVPCDIDPQVEHPEDRPGSAFHHPDLLPYVAALRPQLVVAGLQILRAYHLAGRPPHGKPRRGSFEAWDDLIRGALIWAGAADPLTGCERIRETADVEREALREALEAWSEVYGVEAATASQAVENVKDKNHVRDALAGFVGCEGDRLSARRLGYALRTAVGQIAGGLRFEREGGSTHGVARWKVVPMNAPGGDGGDGGDV